MKTIGFISTSRADFGIYMPLIRAIDKHPELTYRIFAGGSHMSEIHGLSYKLIEEAGFEITEKVESLRDDDSPLGIASAMGATTTAYTNVYKKHAKDLDLLFVLGDRYEMFAAAAAAIPFNLCLAHLHGGETTLGAIDNQFRNAISAFSNLHFTSTQDHMNRVSEIHGSTDGVYNVGALAIEAMHKTPLLSAAEFQERFDIGIEGDYILATYHPETVNLGENKRNIAQFITALRQIPEQVLCSLPNADTEGSIIREALKGYEVEEADKIKCFENLGQVGYYTAMKNASLLIGNSSSGIIEASFYNKPVVNVGDRQNGRSCGENVVHVKNETGEILAGYERALKMRGEEFDNVYGKGDTSSQIIDVLLAG